MSKPIEAPERIWLLPHDGEQRCWSDVPDPSGLGHEADATLFVRADLAPAPAVKALEWGDSHHVKKFGMVWSIHRTYGMWYWHGPDGANEQPYEFSWQAQEAAQADYERRIRSALATPVVPEPAPDVVAWLHKPTGHVLSARDFQTKLPELQERFAETHSPEEIEADFLPLALSHAQAGWRSMDSAPKDGTMLRLLVRPGTAENEGWTPFSDSSEPYGTIGFNALSDTLEDVWQFAGWDWSHDRFTDGAGTVIGWMPLPTLPSAPGGQ